jgi:hypothetical protein
MAKTEIKSGIVAPSQEEIESLTGKGAKEGLIPWIPKEWKREIATALGLAIAGGVGAGAGVSAFNWYLEHRPAITEPVSATQIPPEIVVHHETEKAPAEDFLVQIQVPEPIVPSEKPPEVEPVTSYEVQPGDTLTAIAKKFGLPWPALYGKNVILIGENPGSIRAGDTFVIPDKEKDRELIKALTPREIPESEFGVGGPEEASRYFPETGHYISGPFLEFFKKYGLDVLGYPISEQSEIMPGQFFQRIELQFSQVDGYNYLPERPKYDSPGPHLYPKPIGWSLYFNPEGKFGGAPYPGDPEFPMPGEIELAKEFKDFHQTHGGNEILGYPMSEPKWENGVLVQWLTNTRLEYRPDNPGPYKVQLGLLGQEYADAFIEDKTLFEREPSPTEEPPTQQEIFNLVVKENPEKLKELEARAIAAVVYQLNEHQSSFGDWTQERDYTVVSYHRFDKLVGLEMDERPFDYQTALMALVWHERMYQENLVVKQVLEEAIPGTKAINSLLVDKLKPELFKENEIPQIPENLQEVLERIVFGGGYEALGGGEGGGRTSAEFSTLFGRYDLLEMTNPEDIEEARRVLARNAWHELTHSLIQFRSKEQGAGWWEKRGLLWHMSMGTIGAVGEETIGLESHFDPRMIYIYTCLKNGGIEDPYGLLVRTAATANEKKLWDIYEKVRKPEDLSMDELLSTNDPDPNFTYHTLEEFEAFRAEYLPYLGK